MHLLLFSTEFMLPAYSLGGFLIWDWTDYYSLGKVVHLLPLLTEHEVYIIQSLVEHQLLWV
jgi:hypothetical protein